MSDFFTSDFLTPFTLTLEPKRLSENFKDSVIKPVRMKAVVMFGDANSALASLLNTA
jgi:hypothetical protein